VQNIKSKQDKDYNIWYWTSL